MAKPQNLIASINGMNNRIDPERLPVNKDANAGFAAEIVNMRVTEDGSVSRDYGNTLILSGNYHSMYCDESLCYVGKDQTIQRFLGDETEREIITGLSGNRFSWTKLGAIVFYSDTVANHGIIKNNTAYEWRTQKYLQDTERVFSGPPVPRHMTMLNGRMYMVPADEPDTILWSERGQVGLYNRADSFRRFESNIKLLAAVKEGLFVSTEERTVFLRVSSPHVIILEPRASYPAVEWSMAYSKSTLRDYGFDLTGECRFWRSEEGDCIGTDQGEFLNITERNLILPDKCNNSGASIVIGSYLYSTAK